MPAFEQVIAVPMISLDWVPQRSAVRRPQKAEQLVEVPTEPGCSLAVIAAICGLARAEQLVEVLTVVSYSSLQQQSAEQNVDIPVPGTRGDHGGLQGFHPRQSSTASV